MDLCHRLKTIPMHPYLRIALALVVGYAVGSMVNMGIILLGIQIVPLPEGIDPMDSESLAAGMPLMEFKHFVSPWLAHALGTLVGALVAVLIVKAYKLQTALIMGTLFLLAGIYNVIVIPAPTAFVVADLVLAFIPMALLGYRLAGGHRHPPTVG